MFIITKVTRFLLLKGVQKANIRKKVLIQIVVQLLQRVLLLRVKKNLAQENLLLRRLKVVKEVEKNVLVPTVLPMC